MTRRLRNMSFAAFLVVVLGYALPAQAGACFSEFTEPVYGFYFVDCSLSCDTNSSTCTGYCSGGGGVASFQCDGATSTTGICACNQGPS
jgi:hypothetical protein